LSLGGPGALRLRRLIAFLAGLEIARHGVPGERVKTKLAKAMICNNFSPHIFALGFIAGTATYVTVASLGYILLCASKNAFAFFRKKVLS
jgi:hypothetical protein